MEQKQKSHIRPIVIVMIFAFITIGYAYLTSALNINGSTLLKKPTWDVHFENIQVKDGSVTGDQVIDEPEIDAEQTTVTFHVNLKLPGDYYEFTVDAVNAGTIDAMIDNYTDLELTAAQQKYLETSITYEDGEEVLEHQQLLAGDTAVYKVRVGYKLDLDAEDLPDSPEQLDLEFSVEFVQRDDSAIGRRAERTLYNFFKNEANNGGLVRKYIGEHQDSMDASKSTKDIYYWYASNDNYANTIRNMNNVIFANKCWQMYRTTDTGGIKLIYNGEATDNKCLDSRSGYIGFYGIYSNQLNSNYYYGTDYEYNSETGKFKIAGDIIRSSWSDSTYMNILNKYSCKSTTSANTECSDLIYTYSYFNRTNAYVLYLSSTSNYSQYGSIQFNNNYLTPNCVGYMFGDELTVGSFKKSITENYTDNSPMIYNSNLSTTYWYADDINYDSSTNRYTLANPYQISSTDDYSSLVNKYTLFSTSETKNDYGVYYITNVVDTKAYYKYISSGKTKVDYSTFYIGNSFTDNGDNTYTINSPTSISLNEWYTNFSNYKNKYVCFGNSTCSDPKYLTNTALDKYYYIDATKKILIAKSRNGLQLQNTSVVSFVSLYRGSSSYSDYKYTCNSTSDLCTESNLRFITSYSSGSYVYSPNRYFGSSVVWNGTNYTLQNTVDLENTIDYDALASHHFYCLDYGKKTCNNVAYITTFQAISTTVGHYVLLKDGMIDGLDALAVSTQNNKNDSAIKVAVDEFYRKELSNYSEFLEDTIFCNDRTSVSNTSWHSSNGTLGTTSFRYLEEKDLSCPSIYDRFSVSNDNAKLKYPIGLVTASEINLLNNGSLITTNSSYYTMTPRYYIYTEHTTYQYSTMFKINSNGNVDLIYMNELAGLRPSIALKSGIIYSSGDGSKNNPYIIDTN